MNNIRATLAVTVLSSTLLIGCGGAGMDFQTLTSPEARFGEYSTIAYAGPEVPIGFERATVPDAYKSSARVAARGELDRLGWIDTDVESADVIIRAGVGKRTRTETRHIVQSPNIGLGYATTAHAVNIHRSRNAGFDFVLRGQAILLSAITLCSGHSVSRPTRCPQKPSFGSLRLLASSCCQAAH